MTVIYTAQREAPQKTRGMLFPLLVVLFIISYAILTLLVVEQGRTIEAQRSLLREMLKDSTQLAALKEKMARETSARSPQNGASSQAGKPSTGDDTASASPKAPNKETKQPGKSEKTLREIPGKPPADLQDVRRSTRVI